MKVNDWFRIFKEEEDLMKKKEITLKKKENAKMGHEKLKDQVLPLYNFPKTSYARSVIELFVL